MSVNPIIFDSFIAELEKEAGMRDVLRSAGLAGALTVGALGQGGVSPPEVNPIPPLELPEDIKRVDAKVTNYCTCPTCCGKFSKDGPHRPTAFGGKASAAGAAVDPRAIPKRSWLFIPGQGWVVADDTGGGMRKSWEENKEYHVDLRQAAKPGQTEEQRHEDAKTRGVARKSILIGPVFDKRNPTPPSVTVNKQNRAEQDLVDLLTKYDSDRLKLSKKTPIPAPAAPNKSASRPSAKKPKRPPPPLPFMP